MAPLFRHNKFPRDTFRDEAREEGLIHSEIDRLLEEKRFIKPNEWSHRITVEEQKILNEGLIEKRVMNGNLFDGQKISWNGTLNSFTYLWFHLTFKKGSNPNHEYASKITGFSESALKNKFHLTEYVKMGANTKAYVDRIDEVLLKVGLKK